MCEIIKKKKESVLFLHLRFGFWQILSALVQIYFLFFSVDSTDQINIFTANHEPPVLMFGVTEALF